MKHRKKVQMRDLTKEDLDFFATVMPEWLGKTPEEGRKKSKEWLEMRRKEQQEEKAQKEGTK